MSAGADPEEQVVRPALEAAFDVAEAGLSERPPRQPPRGLQAVLGFHKRPSAALSAVRRVLDRDDAFRAVVLERVDASRLSPGAAAFLVRDEGWRDVVDQAVRALEEAAGDERARADERAATDEVTALSARVEQLEAEAAARSDELKRLVDAERRVEDSQVALAELASANDRLVAERQRAVRELAAERRRLAERTAEVRALSAELNRPTDRSAGGQREAELADALSTERTRAVAAEATAHEAARTAARLAAELGRLADGLAPDVAAAGRDEPPAERTDDAGTAGTARTGHTVGRTPRRRPVRVGRGLREGSAEATKALLSTPDLVLWVDGYNASMALWGDLELGGQREALIGALGRLARACGTRIRIVFDGDTGGAPAVSTPLPVRVVFTAAGVEADDDIIDAVAATDHAVPVAVLSADRRVRDGAAAHGANLLSPDDLRAVLTNGG